VGRIARAGIIVALVALYYLVPRDHSSAAAIMMLVIGLVAFILLVGLQVRWILVSPFPGLSAGEALRNQHSVLPALVHERLRRDREHVARQFQRVAHAQSRAVLHRHRVLHGLVR